MTASKCRAARSARRNAEKSKQMSNRYTRKEIKDLKDFAEALLKMKEYSITEQQLEKLYMNLDELSGLHNDMGDYDICVNPLDLEDAKKKLNETIRELKYLVEDIEGQEMGGSDHAR